MGDLSTLNLQYLQSVINSDTPKIKDNILSFSSSNSITSKSNSKSIIYFGGLKLVINQSLKNVHYHQFGVKEDTLLIEAKSIPIESIEEYGVLINGQSNERSNSKSGNDSISWSEQINFEKKSDRVIAQISPLTIHKNFLLDFEAQYSSNTKSTRTHLVLRERSSNANVDETSSQSDVSPVIISHHPFSVSKISKYAIDSDTEDIYAVWDSEEPSGLFLRPVLSLNLEMQPQGVAHEMERGKRSWHGDKPTIEQGKPVKTRICGITALTLSHNELASSRYVLAPNDIEHWLSKSKVQKLIFEAVYPLQISYEKDKSSDTSIAIDEIGNHILSPAIPWDPVKKKNDKDDVFSDLNLSNWLSPSIVNYLSNTQNKTDYKEKWLVQYKFRRLTHIGVGIALQRRIARYNIINDGQPKKPLNLSGKELTAKLVPPIVNKDYAKIIEEDSRKTAYPISQRDKNNIDIRFFSEISNQHIGLLGLFEFQSELNAVLRNPNATSLTTKIDYLILSAIGATTQLESSFDEGRTSFQVEVVDAHSVKLIKSRIGRIACIKNKAKHIVEYIVSVCPSSQFAKEQGEENDLTDEDKIKYLKLGWPIIRKSDEYIQIEEQRRVFLEEENLGLNQAPKIKASYFPSNKIYVNSAWGEELEHGYKIPLFKENDPSGFYVKPVYALVCYGKDGEDANHYHDQPQNAYFYTNTQEGKGADSDAWEHFISIDYRSDAHTPALYECINPFNGNDRPIVTPALSTKWQSDPKFDWLVRSESPCNLVHGRDGANEPLLANVSVASIDRREARNPRLNKLKQSYKDIYILLVPTNQGEVPKTSVSFPLQQAAELRTLEALINRLPAELEKIIIGFTNPSIDCDEIKSECINKINQHFVEGKNRLDDLKLIEALIPAKGSIHPFIQEQFGVLEKEIDLAKKFVEDKKAPFDAAISKLMLVINHVDLQKELRQVCETELLTFIDKKYNRIEYQAKEVFPNIQVSLEEVRAKCNTFDEDFQKVLNELEGIHQAIDLWSDTTDINAAIDKLKKSINSQLEPINNATTQLDTIEKLLKTLILKSSGFISDILNICLTKVQFLRQTIKQLTSNELEAFFKRIKSEIEKNTSWDLETKKKAIKKLIDSKVNFIDQKILGLDSTYKEFISLVSNNLEKELNDFKNTIYDTLWSVYENPEKTPNTLIDFLGYLSVHIPDKSDLYKVKLNFDQLYSSILKTLDGSETKVKSLKGLTQTSVDILFNSLEEAQTIFQKSLLSEWDILKQQLINQADSIDCSTVDNFIKNIKDVYIKPAENWLKESISEGLAKIVDQRALERYKDLQKLIETTNDYKRKFESKQSAMLTLSEMITHPPQLPNLNLSSQSLALAFAGDASAIINIAPFIARIDVAKGALSALGIDTTHNVITDTFDVITDTFDAITDEPDIYKNQLQNKISNCLKKLGGLDSVFTTFDDELSSKEFKNVNITKDGRVLLNPELQKSIPQERLILESGIFAIALNNTNLNVVADIETEIITAKVQANWALKFNGQALVMFENVQLTYSSNGDYHFELDPKKVRLHPSLKFISDLMSAVENSLPPGVEFEKGSQNQIIGVKASMVQQFPGFSIAAANIGPFSIQSWFGLRFASGVMELAAGFGLGTQNAPVYIQFGAYGGGGWLGANVLYNPKLPIDYHGFMGIAVGSMKQFNIAGIARGSYAILIFANAQFSETSTYLEAGLLVNGSARILGYINAHLALKLSVEYNGSNAHGKGEIDLEIEICWCYSVHIHSAVDQDF